MGVRQHHGELFASVPGDKITSAMALVNGPGYYLQALVASLMTVVIVVKFKMVHIEDQERKRLLQLNVASPLLEQILIEPAPVGNLRKAIDACLLAFLRKAVTLVHKNLYEDFEVSFLSRYSSEEFLQPLLSSAKHAGRPQLPVECAQIG